MATSNGKSVLRTVSLPITRVKMIMKSSPEVQSISHEALHLITLATEQFIQYLSQMALQSSDDDTSVEYGDLAEGVNQSAKLEFLQDIIPCKIKARDYLEMIKNKEEVSDDDYM